MIVVNGGSGTGFLGSVLVEMKPDPLQERELWLARLPQIRAQLFFLWLSSKLDPSWKCLRCIQVLVAELGEWTSEPSPQCGRVLGGQLHLSPEAWSKQPICWTFTWFNLKFISGSVARSFIGFCLSVFPITVVMRDTWSTSPERQVKWKYTFHPPVPQKELRHRAVCVFVVHWRLLRSENEPVQHTWSDSLCLCVP